MLTRPRIVGAKFALLAAVFAAAGWFGAFEGIWSFCFTIVVTVFLVSELWDFAVIARNLHAVEEYIQTNNSQIQSS